MIIGTCDLELFIPEATSLKAKRKVIKSLKDRVRNKFNVSIAEIDMQNIWQRSVLGIACVSNDNKHIDAVLNKVVSFIETTDLAIISRYKIQIW